MSTLDITEVSEVPGFQEIQFPTDISACLDDINQDLNTNLDEYGFEQEVHIHVIQRTTRKHMTIIRGLDEELNLKAVLKALKKEFCCNGAIKEDNDGEKFVKLSGDQAQNVKKFLEREKIAKKIILHGGR